MRTVSAVLRNVLAIIVAGAAFAGGEDPSLRQGTIVGQAQALIGRPLTPMSYAGVARRTTRRAVAVGAAAAPVVVAPVAPVVVAPRCRQIVTAYGQVVTRCY